MDRKWSALPVPYAMEVPDRVPKERYFDPDFYAMEAELLWPRVWQMACRLEEIPAPRDFVEYEFLDQSDRRGRGPTTWGCARSRTRAAIAASRSPRGAGRARAGSPARSTGGATASTARTPHVTQRKTFAEHNLRAGATRPHARAVRDVGRLRVDQSRRRCAAAAASASSPSRPSSTRGRWSRCGQRSGTRARLPVNWKLARSGVRRAVPRGGDPPRAGHPRAVLAAARGAVRPAQRSSTRRSTTCARDERRHGRDGARERRAHRRGPARHRAARRPDAGNADLAAHAQRRGRELAPRARAATSPTSTSSTRVASTNRWPTASRTTSCCRCTAARPSYRFRPLGPEETLMEIWSLARFPEGEEPAEARAARALGERRSAVAADPRAGLLEPAAPAAGPAREGLRVPAPVGARRGAHLQLRTDRRRLPCRPPVRAAAARAALGQREPARPADRRPRHLMTQRTRPTPRSSRASARPSPPTPRRSTTAGPTTSSPPSAPTASARSRAWAPTTATTPSARPTPDGSRGGPSATSSSTRSSPTGTTTRPTRSAT